MIRVTVGDKQIAACRQIQPVVQRVRKRVGGQIDKQIVVDYGLGTCAQVPAAGFLCTQTVVAVAEYCGPAFCSGSAEVSEFHKTNLPFGVRMKIQLIKVLLTPLMRRV